MSPSTSNHHPLLDAPADTNLKNVFSTRRLLSAPPPPLPPELTLNTPLQMDGLAFLGLLPTEKFPVAFFDPLNRRGSDAGANRRDRSSCSGRRAPLEQMSEKTIRRFMQGIDRVLIPSGHLFLWIDRRNVCEGVNRWLTDTRLEIVDLVTWDKHPPDTVCRQRTGVEHCVVLQKRPRRAKGVWHVHDIRDVHREIGDGGTQVHSKPVRLQGRLIAAVSHEGDVVIDPAAGSFSVLRAATMHGRTFLGCDLNSTPPIEHQQPIAGENPATRSTSTFAQSQDGPIAVPQRSRSIDLTPDTRIKMDGMKFLGLVPELSVPVAFLDPQYRGVLDKLEYGNEGKSRGKRRSELRQMPEETIRRFICGIDRALRPSGFLFLWVDKFHLCQGIHSWLVKTDLQIVDLVTWDKCTFGMGYRTRRCSEHCFVLQKHPRTTDSFLGEHGIRVVHREKVTRRAHPHAKPVGLQSELIAAASREGDTVIDPAAGSFSVLQAAKATKREFLGCDVKG